MKRASLLGEARVIYWLAAAVVAAAAAVVAAAVVGAHAAAAHVAAAAEQDEQDDDPQTVVAAETVVIHKITSENGFWSSFTAHSMLFRRPILVTARQGRGPIRSSVQW